MWAIHARLRHDIVRLEFHPGQRLSENEIALRFGTSRAPVREALIRLAEEGLIEVWPQRGSFVTRISLAAMKRARFVREAVEISVVRTAAATGLSDAAYAGAEQAIAAQEAAGENADRFTTADDAFHRALVEAIGLNQLWAVLEREKVQFDRIRYLSVGAATPVATLIKQHKDILSAVRARDPGAAEAAMRAHMAEVLKAAQMLLSKFPELIADES